MYGGYSKNTIRRRIVCYILSFGACMISFIICSLFLSYITFLNSDYVTANIEKTGYYVDLQEEVKNDFIHLGKLSGVPEKVFEDVVTLKMLADSTNLYINTQMHDQTYERDSRNLSIILRDKVDKNFKKQGVNISDVDFVKNADDFVNACLNSYYDNILIKYVHGFGLYVNKVNSYIVYAILIFMIFDLILFGLIFMFNRRIKTKIRFIIVSLLGTVILLFVVPAGVALSGIIEKVNVDSEILYNMVTQMMYKVVNTYYLFGFILAVITLGLFLEYLRKEKLSTESED